MKEEVIPNNSVLVEHGFLEYGGAVWVGPLALKYYTNMILEGTSLDDAVQFSIDTLFE